MRSKSKVKLEETLEKRGCLGSYNAGTHGTKANYAKNCICNVGDACQDGTNTKICSCGDGLVCDSNSNECAPSITVSLGKLTCIGTQSTASISLSASQSAIIFSPALQGKDFVSCSLPMIVNGGSGYQFELQEVELTGNGGATNVTVGVTSSSEKQVYTSKGPINSFLPSTASTITSSCFPAVTPLSVYFSTSNSINAIKFKFNWSTC